MELVMELGAHDGQVCKKRRSAGGPMWVHTPPRNRLEEACSESRRLFIGKNVTANWFTIVAILNDTVIS